jgi:AcrR family transcriptional regulator
MGNREDLLAAAKRCLYEKGYTRTTARDIRDASGVSLAAIGYHFGSKEALMNAALLEAIEEWGNEIARMLAVETAPAADPLDRVELAWERVIASFDTHRPMWVASFELFGQIDEIPEIRTQLAAVMKEARLGLAELFQGIDPATDEKRALAIGTFYYALLSGVVTQWLIDPAQAPSARDLTDALRAITADIGPDAGGHP